MEAKIERGNPRDFYIRWNRIRAGHTTPNPVKTQMWYLCLCPQPRSFPGEWRWTCHRTGVLKASGHNMLPSLWAEHSLALLDAIISKSWYQSHDSVSNDSPASCSCSKAPGLPIPTQEKWQVIGQWMGESEKINKSNGRRYSCLLVHNLDEILVIYEYTAVLLILDIKGETRGIMQ